MSNEEEIHLNIRGATHPGLTGKINEDRFKITSFNPGSKRKYLSTVIVLCDGIGGHRAGDVAAEMGVSLITEKIIEGNHNSPLKTIEQAIIRTSEAIYQASIEEQDQRGMGATVAVAWVLGDRLYTANLGDTRIYLWRKNYLVQLTTDHTWVQEALDAGLISDKTGIHHANVHVIRRYLGSKNPPQPDFRLWFFEREQDVDAIRNQGHRLHPGDILLLCSDGLTDLVTDEEIQDVLKNAPVETTPERLIELANLRGGHDNITVVCAQVPRSGRGVFKKENNNRVVGGCMIILIFLSLLIAVTFFGLRWRNQNLHLEKTPKPGLTLTLPEVTSTRTETGTPTIVPSATLTREIDTQRPTITPWPTNTR